MNQKPPTNQMKKRLGPGVWVDMADHLHFSVPELLAHFKVEDTPENRAILQEKIREVFSKEAPNSMLIYRQKPD